MEKEQENKRQLKKAIRKVARTKINCIKPVMKNQVGCAKTESKSDKSF